MSENLQESEAQDFPGLFFLPLSSKSASPGIGLLRYKYYLTPEARFQDLGFGLELPRILVLGKSWAAPFVWRNDNFPTQWPVCCRKNPANPLLHWPTPTNNKKKCCATFRGSISVGVC